jgi:hypothetical protein
VKPSQGSVPNQIIQTSVTKPNLRITNLSILNSSGLGRTFEFKIQNNASISYSNISWQLNISSNNPLNSALNITLAQNETIFVYAYFLYSQPRHNCNCGLRRQAFRI